MNSKQQLLTALTMFGLLAGANQAWSFERSISLQGYLKSGTTAVSGRYAYRVIVTKNGSAAWCKDFAKPSAPSPANDNIVNGVLSTALSGNGSNCGSDGNFTAVSIGTLFDSSIVTDAFGSTIKVDVDDNGVGTGTDARFDINMNAVPMALSANSLSSHATITSGNIPTDAVTTVKIIDDAVTTAKILDANVTTAKINDGAITSAKLAAGAVDAAAIASGAVGSAAIATGAVGSGALATGAVASAALGAGAVDATAIGTDAVVTAKIQNGAVTSAKLAAGAVDATALGADAVVTAKILDSNVTTSKIADANVTAVKMAASSVNLATSVVTNQLPMAKGGTGANLTADNGGIVYSDASAMAVLAAGSSGQFLKSNGAAAPAWTSIQQPASRSAIYLHEDFLWVPTAAVNTTVAMGGTAVWSSFTAGGTAAALASPAAGVNGVVRMTTGTTAAANAYLGFCGQGAAGGTPTLTTRFEANEPWSFEARLAVSAIAANNGTIRIGFMAAPGGATAGAGVGAYSEINTGVVTAQSRNAGLTSSATTSTIAAATYNRWGVSYDGAGVVSFTKDGVVYTTINATANIPSATAGCFYINTVGGTVARTIDVDYITLSHTTSNR